MHICITRPGVQAAHDAHMHHGAVNVLTLHKNLTKYFTDKKKSPGLKYKCEKPHQVPVIIPCGSVRCGVKLGSGKLLPGRETTWSVGVRPGRASSIVFIVEVCGWRAWGVRVVRVVSLGLAAVSVVAVVSLSISRWTSVSRVGTRAIARTGTIGWMWPIFVSVVSGGERVVSVCIKIEMCASRWRWLIRFYYFSANIKWERRGMKMIISIRYKVLNCKSVDCNIPKRFLKKWIAVWLLK